MAEILFSLAANDFDATQNVERLVDGADRILACDFLFHFRFRPNDDGNSLNVSENFERRIKLWHFIVSENETFTFFSTK